MLPEMILLVILNLCLEATAASRVSRRMELLERKFDNLTATVYDCVIGKGLRSRVDSETRHGGDATR